MHNLFARKRAATRELIRISGAWSVLCSLPSQFALRHLNLQNCAKMLEFCDTINPSLEDYEAEAVSPDPPLNIAVFDS